MKKIIIYHDLNVKENEKGDLKKTHSWFPGHVYMELNDGQNSSIVLGIESGFKELKLSVKEMYEEYQEYKCVDSEKRLQVAKNYIVLICEMEEFLK
jgi:hypothetical protein